MKKNKPKRKGHRPMVHVRIPPDLHRRATMLAALSRTNLSAVTVAALDSYCQSFALMQQLERLDRSEGAR